jgi:Ca-activated chloride channel family protein
MDLNANLNAALHAFHFLRPRWLLALPPLIAAAAWLARRRAGDGNWARLIDPELLAGLRLEGAAVAARPVAQPWPWLALAWCVAVLALAGPAWEQDAVPAFRAPAAWVLVLDLSPSMQAADLSPDRVTRARYALDDLLGAARDARVALVVFSDEAYTVAPLTEDVATVRALLPPLAPDLMPAPGDRLAPALDRAAGLLKQAGSTDSRVIVLTDGFADPAAALASAQQLGRQGVALTVVGVGTSDGAPLSRADGSFAQNARGQAQMTRLDPALLQSLASAGRGNYLDLAALPTFVAGLQQRHDSGGGASAARDIHIEHWRDAGVWLLPGLLLIVAWFGRRGWL